MSLVSAEVVRRGPRRAPGEPSGVNETRRAVLDAATRLFATRGVDGVSLREVAAEANVHTELIRRYVGNREALIVEVFDDVSRRLAEAVTRNPLEGQGFDADTVMGQWVRIAASLTISGRPLHVDPELNPVTAMAETLVDGYQVDARSARLRAAQIVAAALGWRVFEDYLVAAAGLEDVSLEQWRGELVHSARRLGATRWPSPDPIPRSARVGRSRVGTFGPPGSGPCQVIECAQACTLAAWHPRRWR